MCVFCPLLSKSEMGHLQTGCEKGRKGCNTYVGGSSQALGWWLLELFEELPRSKKNKTHRMTYDQYILDIQNPIYENIFYLDFVLKHVQYSLCPLGKVWDSWSKYKKEKTWIVFTNLLVFLVLHYKMYSLNLTAVNFFFVLTCKR